jgi:hypothetical protein
MDVYLAKYAGTGISMLIGHTIMNKVEFDYLDPITTVVKLCLIGHKKIGTKIGIHDHMLTVQEPYLLQGIQRFIKGNDRNQLYQLKWPLIYFHGITLGHLETHICQEIREFFKLLEDKAITGLKRLKMTYSINTDNDIGSMITNCLDTYIQILSETKAVTLEDFNKHMSYLTPMIMTIYQEYTTKWTLDEIRIIEQILSTIENKNDKKAQSDLCDMIDSFLAAKDRDIATIRPV